MWGTPEGLVACQNLIPNQEGSRKEEFVLKEQQPCKPGDRNTLVCFASLPKALLGAFSPPIPSFYLLRKSLHLFLGREKSISMFFQGSLEVFPLHA